MIMYIPAASFARLQTITYQLLHVVYLNQALINSLYIMMLRSIEAKPYKDKANGIEQRTVTGQRGFDALTVRRVREAVSYSSILPTGFLQ
ncbi:hypothetical protein MUK42_10731 [Musa troglodytarum]|uniref:Uncharacterized protein n=1 Tax=Musa troglodytarum TaxID=320322 RepID=A0A9E7FLG4_9LILI|nr:hypothetical protein MUK42_10731 [Musa troglodytarum]